MAADIRKSLPAAFAGHPLPDAAPMAKADKAEWDALVAEANDDRRRAPLVYRDNGRKRKSTIVKDNGRDEHRRVNPC